MSEASFVHLHVHTQYSLLQGAIRVPALMDRVAALGMPAVAMTDTNNLFGAIDFYMAAKKAGVKPIIGCEVLFAPDGRFAAAQVQAGGKTPSGEAAFKPRHHHLVLLCKNLDGYRNLCKLITRAYREAPLPQKGQPAGPRALVDRELLAEHGDELIVLSGCLRGEIPYKLVSGDEEGAWEAVRWFHSRFKDDFYLEIQDSGLPEQSHVNDALFAFGEKHGIACVATADCHYLEPSGAESHEVLQCIENGRNLDLDRPKSLVPPDHDLKSGQAMRERFERYPGACDRTLEIAAKCGFDFKFKDADGRQIYHLPAFRPEGVEKGADFDAVAFFREQSRKGLERRFLEPQFDRKRAAPDWEAAARGYRERLESEIEMVLRTGFAGYFLIVADFINWAKERAIPVGPGRGSGAGSIVAYSLRITDVDPIEYNLLFERFINPERVTMPDFDVDFCQDRRGEVIEYVTKKYGAENVAQIITFGKLQAKAVVKDVGRVLGLTFAEADRITKLFPNELNIKLEDALNAEPKLRELIETDSKVAKVFEYALALEGLSRNAGIHAAGVIITEEPVVNYCPLYVSGDGDVVTQFDKDFAEYVGLVKFDFLGLKTLTVIDNAVKLIRAGAEPGSPDAAFDLARIDVSDPVVFALISSGDTDGVFQVESSGMKDLCARLQPSSIEDLSSINALYRPGPLGSGMVDDFIDRKHGRKEISYEFEALKAILKDTYGVIVYQEQVMQIARDLAGYSLGQADMLRRAMGKKKADEMAKHKATFVEGAVQRGHDGPKAEALFDLMAMFAEYGFNKSHSVAYSVLTYQTAFLKARYPAEFMAALMTTEMSNTDKLARYIGDARKHAIPVLPPDVNVSGKVFSVERPDPDKPAKAVRFGLEAIKGVGGIAVEAILEARGGAPARPFSSVVDLTGRVPIRKVNKKVLEALVQAGALDSISEVNRASLFESLDGLVRKAADEQEERALGQSSLFDSFTADEIKLVTPGDALFKKIEDWPLSKKLSFEKQVVGFYVSGHPMDAWQRLFEDRLGWSTERVVTYAAERAGQPAAAPSPGSFRAPKKEVRLAGLISSMREVMTKKGTRMAFGELEDLHGRLELVFFPDAFAELAERVKQAQAETEAVIVTGDLELRDEAPKILVKALEWAKDAYKGTVGKLTLRLDARATTADQLRTLKKTLLDHRGKSAVAIEFSDPGFRTRLEFAKDLRVEGTPELIRTVNRIFGRDVVEFR